MTLSQEYLISNFFIDRPKEEFMSVRRDITRYVQVFGLFIHFSYFFLVFLKTKNISMNFSAEISARLSLKSGALLRNSASYAIIPTDYLRPTDSAKMGVQMSRYLTFASQRPSK